MKTIQTAGRNIIIVAIAAHLCACAGMTTREKNATIGAGAGAVAGAILTGGSGVGTVGGAVVGGVIGNEIKK
ncbi:glycine zipper 2TM domain-containing protein [Undibacterium sp. RuRC25W]|uniref:glycine zipper 2TM domain-containing protein n=1 Tax=Undibacterium sp. RuRC25W TaxID=3413047 RepID=UPI003BF3930D